MFYSIFRQWCFSFPRCVYGRKYIIYPPTFWRTHILAYIIYMDNGLRSISFVIYHYITLMALALADFKYCVMNNRAFPNVFRNSQKSFHTSPRSSDPSYDRGYRSIFQLNINGTCIYGKNPRIFCKCKWHCWVWVIGSLYYSSKMFPERCEISFVHYGIHYPKLCYSLRNTWTQPMPLMVYQIHLNSIFFLNI